LAVHVSIHDVSSAWTDEVEAALAMCHDAGARPALLVVPDFHGRAPLLGDASFCARLRALQAEGHDVYLHGLRHRSGERWERRRAGWRGGRLAWHLSQRVVSAGEAEMADVGPDEGRARVDEGERVLGEAGLRIDGYVAPAWAMPPWLFALLAERGYRFTEDHLRVYDPRSGRRRATVVLNWATRSRARIASTIAWCRAARHARALVPARIAIHPGDMRVGVVRREVERLLAWGRGDFVAHGADLLR
jgi:predicted deacetylase